MRVVIVYESMFGNSRQIAEEIAEGFGAEHSVRLVPVADAHAEENVLDGVDLLVVGAPTHAHSLSRPATRRAASEQAHQEGSGLTLEPGADGAGVRDWLGSLGKLDVWAAAFDTRLDAPPMFTGRASVRIDKLLHHHGARRLLEPESFLVNKANKLSFGELTRAFGWGHRLGEAISQHTAASTHHGHSKGTSDSASD